MSEPLIARPQPATLSDLDRLAAAQAILCARLLNVATGLAVALEELRSQIVGLAPSEHLDRLKLELAAMRAMFNPTRQQRRAAARAAGG